MNAHSRYLFEVIEDDEEHVVPRSKLDFLTTRQVNRISIVNLVAILCVALPHIVSCAAEYAVPRAADNSNAKWIDVEAARCKQLTSSRSSIQSN